MQIFNAINIMFIGEQKGPIEDDLKSKFKELFQFYDLESAYLAKVKYTQDSTSFVSLCIKSSMSDNEKFIIEASGIFSKMFATDQSLDIIFLTPEQEVDLKKVCSPFFLNKHQ